MGARERKRRAGGSNDRAEAERERQRGAPREGNKDRDERCGKERRYEEGAHVIATA